jgi:hypothetical protein
VNIRVSIDFTACSVDELEALIEGAQIALKNKRPGLDADELAILMRPIARSLKRIAAVKAYRVRTMCGLREAVNAVDRAMESFDRIKNA